ncbi:hypothetical protein RJ55_02441 [Drechmeria coniospora]|nr:hypothetical protein RJ55_02441 [Drechmeria coniospora]
MDFLGKFKWRSIEDCDDGTLIPAKYTTSFSIGELEELQIIEATDHATYHDDGPELLVDGCIVLCAAEDNEALGKVELDVISNDEELTPDLQVVNDGNHRTIKIMTPSRAALWPLLKGDPCIQMRIIVRVPRRDWLRVFRLESANLKIHIMSGLTLQAADKTSIHSDKSDVIAPMHTELQLPAPYMIMSREISIRSHEGLISGWYPLYDRLHINCKSHITVQVTPQLVDKNPPWETRFLQEDGEGTTEISSFLSTGTFGTKSNDKTNTGHVEIVYIHGEDVKDSVVTMETTDGVLSWVIAKY